MLVLASVAFVVAAAPSPLVQGEVRRIDAAGSKITLKHGPIPELDLPAMTLVYVVRERAMLDDIKPGDKVRFSADRVDGQYTVVKIER